MKFEACVKELVVHGLAEKKDGKYVLTEEAVELIEAHWVLMRQKFPQASVEDVTIRALIVVVLDKLGLVNRAKVPDFVSTIRTLAQNSE